MNTKLFKAGYAGIRGITLFCLAATARADVEDTITNSFKADPGGQLVVELDRGSIEVKTANATVVDVEITRKARGGQSAAAQTLKDHEVIFAQSGNKVEIKGEYKGKKTKGWFGRSPDLQVKCLVIVPRTFDVDLKTAGGSILVTELTGKVQAYTAGGSLTFKKIEGPLSARTSGGSITVAAAKGKVDGKTSGGGLNLSDIEGDTNAETSGGSIHAEHITGKLVVKTSGGSIQVADIKGPMDARTSGGSITANLPAQPAGDCSLHTSGGNVTVVLDPKAVVDVDLHTSGGRVATDFPVTTVIQGEQKKNELRGKINGGGPVITARTSGGSVRVQRK